MTTARQLYAIAVDDKRPKAERIAAREELVASAKKAKKSVPKLVNLLPEGVDRWSKALALTADDAFEMSQDELEAQRDRQVSEDPLEEKALGMGLPKDAPEKGKPIPAKAAPKKAPKAKEGDERGLISAEIRRLLEKTDEPYEAIVKAVRSSFPSAVTTNRSVASVASDMRARGTKVPFRRVAAKEKG